VHFDLIQRGFGLSRALPGFVVSLALALSLSAEAHDAARLDCGSNALFVLLRLEGHPVNLEHVESALPVRHPDGYSMGDLAAAAGRLGVGLEGVLFAKGDTALKHSAIAFLKDAKGGHFAVLRPVGNTCTMVQVIDPPHVPWIADYDRVLSSSMWTGKILVPRDPWIVRNAVALVTCSIGLILLVTGLGYGLKPAHRHPRGKSDEPAKHRDKRGVLRYLLGTAQQGGGNSAL
jgi:Peptidase C39 family